MIVRKFYTLSEAIEFVGDWKMLQELVEFHGLHAFVKIGRTRAESHMDAGGDPWEDSLRRSGEHDLCHWYYVQPKPAEGKTEARPDYYVLSGWFELTTQCTLQFMEGCDVRDASVHSYLGGKRFGDFFDTDIVANAENSRFLVADLVQLKASIRPPEAVLAAGAVEQQSRAPTLRTDREETLLRTIAALWATSELDGRPNTAARRLVDEISLWNWDKPGTDTFAAVLKQAAMLAKGKHPKFG
jgi:hypothetical protein